MMLADGRGGRDEEEERGWKKWQGGGCVMEVPARCGGEGGGGVWRRRKNGVMQSDELEGKKQSGNEVKEELGRKRERKTKMGGTVEEK